MHRQINVSVLLAGNEIDKDSQLTQRVWMHFSLKQVTENLDLKSWVQNCTSPLQGGLTHKHVFFEVNQSPSAPRFTVVLISKEECESLVPFHFSFFLLYFSIAEIITVTPLYMVISGLLNYTDSIGDTVFYRNVSWNPRLSQKGRHIFCFKAVDNFGWVTSTKLL